MEEKDFLGQKWFYYYENPFFFPTRLVVLYMKNKKLAVSRSIHTEIYICCTQFDTLY